MERGDAEREAATIPPTVEAPITEQDGGVSGAREFHGFAFPDGRSTLDTPSFWKAFVKELAGADGNEITITACRRRSKRSLKQNKFFHAAIAPLAEHLGYTTEELKLDLLGTCFGWKEMKSGSKVPERLHTSDLNTKDFAQLMDHTMQIAAENGIVILDPSEYGQSKRKREKAAKAA
jgi:hypothetical protein